jgi:uncharacterized protein YbbC (DUF1343 family)/CubicO group peptidase (beta-lactamase class C family)
MKPLLFLISAMLLVAATARAEINPAALAPIREVVKAEIAAGRVPGAVVLVGQKGKTLFLEAFGQRATFPKAEPMTVDTIFDLASLTKVVCTAPSVLKLVEQGKIRLEDPVALYWPEFGGEGKSHILVRDLLTHYSGLPEGLVPNKKNGRNGHAADILAQIAAIKPHHAPGSEFLYSDLNFIVLGELVKRVSGKPLDSYCTENIFKPLHLPDTFFHPPTRFLPRIAPIEVDHGRAPRGRVQDSLAAALGGAAGHAGVFSTARDLGRFAEMMLRGGELDGVRVLEPFTVAKMTSPQSPSGKADIRGLGWDLSTNFSSYQGDLIPPGSYGHTGYTGTSIWIDPQTQTYVIILTSRLHPDGHGDARRLRGLVANVVTAAYPPEDQEAVLSTDPYRARRGKAATGAAQPQGRVATGIDVLEQECFKRLSGKRVGLITNHTGLDSEGRRTIDLLNQAKGVKLVALFSPEHGLTGSQDVKVADDRDPATGLPVHSLYNGNKRPTDAMLCGIDALVFDIQDAGARFYTYITTLGYCMEAAAARHIPIYVLDRPDPISAAIVQGPVLEPELRSFAGYFPLPVRHGMTVGELARLFNTEARIGAKLEVVAMEGYHRAEWFDATGLLWLPPSPNLRTLAQTTLYPGVALIEGANVSVGRGTDNPFEVVGAPWMDGQALAERLNSRSIPGVRFLPTRFTPAGQNRYQGQLCNGVEIALVNRDALNAPLLGIELAAALHELWPKNFNLKSIDGMVGTKSVAAALQCGQDPKTIVKEWQPGLAAFLATRQKYLLY